MKRDGTRVSTLDLVAHNRFTLLAGPGVSPRVAEGVTPALCVRVAGRDFTDPDGGWTALAAIGDRGALLVRPDQHVAWRTTALAPGTAAELTRTLARILDR